MSPTRWGEVFPLPLIAIVALLLVLILVTPNLLPTNAPSAGTLATQAELIVDRTPSGNLTHFYIVGLGQVRYTTITYQLAINVSWPPPPSFANLTWGNVTNGTDLLELQFTSEADPVGVNVTATYVDPTGAAIEYYGVFAFRVSSGDLDTIPIAPGLGGLSGLPPTSLTALPITFLLAATPPGTAP